MPVHCTLTRISFSLTATHTTYSRYLHNSLVIMSDDLGKLHSHRTSLLDGLLSHICTELNTRCAVFDTRRLFIFDYANVERYNSANDSFRKKFKGCTFKYAKEMQKMLQCVEPTYTMLWLFVRVIHMLHVMNRTITNHGDPKMFQFMLPGHSCKDIIGQLMPALLNSSDPRSTEAFCGLLVRLVSAYIAKHVRII